MKDNGTNDLTGLSPIVRPLREILREFDQRESEGIRSCIGYPLEEWPLTNKLLSGSWRGSLTLLSTSQEKHRTGFLLEWGRSLIRSSKIPVLYLGFENSSQNLLYRLMSRESGLDLDTLMRLKIKGDPKRRAKLQEGLSAFATYQGYLHFLPGGGGADSSDLEGQVKSLFLRFKSSEAVVIVDTLQRFPATQLYSQESFRLLDALGRLKNMALSLNIPVVVGSSLSDQGRKIDRSETQDPVLLEHCEGCKDFESVADFGLVLSHSSRDTAELRDQLRKRADGQGKDAQRLPSLSILEMRLEKSLLSHPRTSAIQFMVLDENGQFLELGSAADQELVRFNRIDKALGELIDQGRIHFKDLEPSSARIPRSDTGMTADSPAKEKIKVSLKLR
jgi:hypothetical protein